MGRKNIFAITCSDPTATNAIMGNHMLTTFAIKLSLDFMAWYIAKFTKKLQIIPLNSIVMNPPTKSALTRAIFASAIAIAFTETAAPMVVPKRSANPTIHAQVMEPIKFRTFL